ncbi:putative RNA polymerase II subunit B1 CTD phosphatase RPAP2 isoform X1 [Bombus fervidus]|uniref:putative RNA polymerase II subunit B1 CTD phosphatase RPAP2 isoform X1 n=2 Tax=Bombus fervidus TaxID=203811 RepID=UPI003AB80F04
MEMSNIRKETFERKKVKKKMSKAQMQLAIIKKKQCDAKALRIVEHLLEPKIDFQWLLTNLRYINKSHMEDIIEERAIIKLCGYVLCSNALTKIIDQRYHISTTKNKVYDITRRKNFCSSHCYGASNYLLEQMLTSPLWLRDKEEIPEFKILLNKDELKGSMLRDEIHVRDIEMVLNSGNTDEHVKNNKTCKSTENTLLSKSSEVEAHDEYIVKMSLRSSENVANNIIEKPGILKEFPENGVTEFVDVKKASINSKDKGSTAKDYINDNTVKRMCTIEANTLLDYTGIQNTTNVNNCATPVNKHENQNIENKEQNELLETSGTEDNTTISKYNTVISNKDPIQKIKQNKNKKNKQQNSTKENQSNKFYNLAIHIEHNVRDWITEDTISLLLGNEDIRNQLLENIVQHDRYTHLCKKLNKLQLEDEKDIHVDLTTNSLKPLPHLCVLQEEGEKMELKVRAFYKGSMIIENHKNTTEVTDQDNDFTPILPLTEAHAPEILRRRIFLDKLNKILPDLLCALASNKLPQYIYSREKSTLIKALVNTFSLSAANVIFKTVEWTLVGLIIIKMLSMIDPELKFVLLSKQASMYISMILMSYKLDSNYIDRLVMELINNTDKQIPV